MAQGYRVDEHVTDNGPRGNGYSYEYDRKTGKYGVKYGTGPNAHFVPDPDEKQPGYRPPREEKSYDTAPKAAGGPSVYDQAMDKLGTEIGYITKDTTSMVLKAIKAIIGFFIGYAAMNTFSNEMAKNPDDMGKAVFKSGRTVACGVGIIADIIALFVCAAIFGAMEGPVVRVIGRIITALELYTVLGLIRIAKDKPFWINPIDVYRKTRAVKVPKIAYIAIELIVTASLTKPVLNWINGFTVEWAQQNQDTVSDSLVITLGVGMLIGSIVIAAIIGFIVCKLIKALTAK